ncbi:hypothetical protein [Haloferax elongans]|uniref:hypothetical protein n=1 Tax=Haloferax elongans TaxID=403191 RepID=UPI001267145B|nr:hypothetical protein [Haloferax elongans]
MVSPHPDWEDTENGYENGSWRLYLRESRRNSFAIEAAGSTLPLPPEGPLLTVEDQRKAWEILNILTWVASYEGLDVLLGNIEEPSPGYGKENWSVGKRVSADIDAKDAVANLLGPYRFNLEPALKGEEPPSPADHDPIDEQT